MGNAPTNSTTSETIDFDELDSQAVLHKNDPNIRKTKEYQLLRNTARQGVPAQTRETFWRKATHANEEDVTKYESLVKDIFEGVPMRDFPKFPKSFFGSSCKFSNLGKEQRQACARILLILAVEHDSLKYCPQLPYVTELMIGFVKEPLVFALCHAMIAMSKKNNWYFRTDFLNFQIRLRTFERIFMENVPIIVNHIDFIGIDIDAIISEGYATMWVNYLNGFTFLRLVDCFLVEGYKVLFRIGVALLQNATTEIIQTKTLEEFKKALIKKSQKLAPDELIKIAFKIHLTRDQFEKLDQLHQQELSTIDIEHQDEMVRRWPSFDKEWLKQSQILKSKADILQLWVWLPEGCHHGDLNFLFATHQHGYKLSTLYFNCQNHKNLLILIETTNEDVIGAFVTTLGEAPKLKVIREPKLRAFILRSKNRVKECYEPIIGIYNNNDLNKGKNQNNDKKHISNNNTKNDKTIQEEMLNNKEKKEEEKNDINDNNPNKNNSDKNNINVSNNDDTTKDKNDLMSSNSSTSQQQRKRSSSAEKLNPNKLIDDKSPRISFKSPSRNSRSSITKSKIIPNSSRSLSPNPSPTHGNNGDMSPLNLENSENDFNNENNNNFPIIIADKKDIRIGDGKFDALYIDESLNRGRTSPCDILQSPSLVQDQLGEFQIKHVEVWCVDW